MVQGKTRGYSLFRKTTRDEVEQRLATSTDRGSWIGTDSIRGLLESDVRWSKVIRLRAAIQNRSYRVSSKMLADRLVQAIFASTM